MAAEEDIPRLQRREVIRAVNMAVGGIEPETVHTDQGVVRHEGEVQDHLVHFRIAVAANAQDAVLPGVQGRNHFLRRVAVRQVIARAVIKDISQQKQAVRLFPVISFEQFIAVQGGTVNIRSNQQFQRKVLLFS